MTMTDAPVAALGEFPAPPPCPTWCETDHTGDFRTLVSWTRYHEINRGVDVPGSRVVVWVTVVDRYYGEGWEQRDKPTLTVQPGPKQYVRASHPGDVRALVALASLISPEVCEAVLAAALLVSSPAVTPAGEDQ